MLSWQYILLAESYDVLVFQLVCYLGHRTRLKGAVRVDVPEAARLIMADPIRKEVDLCRAPYTSTA